MSLSKRKIKNSALAVLSVSLCATLTAGLVLSNFDVKKTVGANSNDSLKFTDVTRDYDTSDLVAQNFNSSVLAAPQTSYEKRTVIVSLEGESLLAAKSTGETVAEYMNSSVGFKHMRELSAEQKNFLNRLDSKNISYKLKNSYTAIANAVAIEVDTSYVSEMKKMSGVTGVEIGRTYLAPQTVEARDGATVAVSNDSFVYKTGIYDSHAYNDLTKYPWGTGAGTVVAVIDTGLDYTHDAFQKMPEVQRFKKSYSTDKEENTTYITDKLQNTTAFKRVAALGGSLSVDDVYINQKIPFAFDYADTDTDVYPSYSNHGTHVAGIIGGYNEAGYSDKDGNVPKAEAGDSLIGYPLENGAVEEGDPLPFLGVAPDCQLVICKAFTDNLDDPGLGGAEAESVMGALEDCVVLGVDVINMSLGTTAGFTSTDDGDEEGTIFNKIYNDIQNSGISLICAASNDYSAGFGSVYGTNLASNPDSATVGSPSTYYAALSVASVSGQKSEYMLDAKGNAIYFENSSDGNSVAYDFIDLMLGNLGNNSETGQPYDEFDFTYVTVGTGQATDYIGMSSLVRGNIVLIQRGGNTFQQKVELARANGARGVIVYNNVSGTIRMSLGDVAPEKFVPAVSITMDAGKLLKANADYRGVGKIKISRNLSAGPFMSPFSSWGPTPDLKIKPEITAHGGEITSTVPGGFAEQSGTSMASPNMAGLTALVRNYVKKLPMTADYTPSQITQLTNQLIMSTATTAYDEENLAYSPRKQGAGLANLDNIVSTGAYIFTDEASDGEYYYAEKDGRPKMELGDDKEKKGVYTFSFNVRNFGNGDLNFTPKVLFMTETLASDGIAVAEKAHMLGDPEKGGIAPVITVDGNQVSTVTVPQGASKTVTVTLKLSDSEKKYIDDSFSNGMFVEGFVKLLGNDEGQCDLTLPFLGFYGDWQKAPMLDMDAYELAKLQQDTSKDEEEKPSATVFATQAYASYWNDDFIIPLGSYVYNQDPDPTKEEIYPTMEHNAISRYNEYYNEEGIGNYLTTYNFRCVYAGLLRNARRVNYFLYEEATGELVKDGHVDRVSKAYSNGGSARPGYVELKLSPDDLGLLANGKYRFDFEFLFDKDSEPTENNTFSFDFYVDYEAPVLQDARLRYYNYKQGNKDKQKIYLDLDVFDNHYAQSVMLCYRDNSDGEVKFNLATDYFTPVMNANRNGVTTVSIEVTDFWDEYKNSLVVQLDDYALNHSIYQLSAVNNSSILDTTTAVNKNVLPDTFELAEGENNVTVNINEAHKIGLVYEGNADPSNFIMTIGGVGITNNGYFAVKNGEVVGLKSTGGRRMPLTISNGKGTNKTVWVTVTNEVSPVSSPEFSFNVIRSDTESLIKAVNSGSVKVNAGEDIQLEVMPDPWYYPMDDVEITWSKTGSAVDVDAKTGKVHTKEKGSSVVTATIWAAGIRYTVNFTFVVNDPFTIDNLALTHYHGDGETVVNANGSIEEGVVRIPEGKNIMSIGEEAFKDNTKITKVIIPKTVTQIGKRAFEGCTNLRGVYFVDDKKVDYSDPAFVSESALTLIDRNAFEGCTALEKLDLSNVKVITVAREAFKDCENLKEVVKSRAIGTAHDRAFLGCKSLVSIDITGLHTAGANVFSGCEQLSEVITGRYSAIGAGMFTNLHYEYQIYDYDLSNIGWKDMVTDYSACNLLKSIEIKAKSVGANAFANCAELASVKFTDVSAESNLEFTVADQAFYNCKKLTSVNFGNCKVKSIGSRAFANTGLTDSGFNLPGGLEIIGAGAFSGTSLTFNGQSGYTVSDNAVISGDTLLYYFGNGNYTVPANVTKIGNYAFANSGVESINIQNVTEIGNYAFADSKLSSITIPSTVTTIGEGAFAGSALASVQINANLTEIPAYAFYNTKLQNITLPATVTEVGDYALANNAELTGFNFAPTNKATLGSFVFSGCTALTSIEFNGNIESLGDRTFMGCTALVSVKLPSIVNIYGADGSLTFKAIGDYTFWNTPKLESVEFGSNSNTVGNYTFAANDAIGRENLKTVKLGNAVKEIGDFAFYNCGALTEINLGGATKIGTSAFMGCGKLATVTGLNGVTEVGAYAFGDCTALTSLEISSVKTVGDFAFAGTGETTVEIPASLTKIGYGAFAASPKLNSFTVASGNDTFMSIDGVLFEYVKNVENGTFVQTGKFTLVAFPSAKNVAEADGEKVYVLPDETVKVAGSAFRGLEGGVDKVVLPYGLKVIGVAAFYDSGITKYEFKGATAPLLETQYSPVIDEIMDDSTSYRGFYYANFEGDFIFYANMASGNVAPLTICRPDNGVGYDNYIFTNYFGNCVLTGVTKSEATNAFIELVEGFVTADEVRSWKEPDMPKSKVEKFSEQVKAAHGYYNTFSNNEYQMSFVYASLITKFNDIETALRQIKKNYNIPVTISSLSYTGNFKSDYKVGEKFDITGLQVIIEYDDYSTEYADMSKVTYDLHDDLTEMNNVVQLTYEGIPLYVRINVSAENPDDDGGCGGGCGSVTSIGGPMTLSITAIGLMFVVYTLSRRKNRGNR